jgi:signal transduction histidine kinase
MKQHWIIFVTALCTIGVAFVLVFNLHRWSKDEVLSLFQKQQLAHARYVTARIHSYLEDQLQTLRSLSSFASVQYGHQEERGRLVEAYLNTNQIEKDSTGTIFICDEKGTVTFSTDDSLRGLNLGEREFFVWAKREDNRGKAFVSPLLEMEEKGESGPTPSMAPGANLGSYRFPILLAIPLYQEGMGSKPAGRGKGFAGALCLSIDLEAFLIDQLRFGVPEIHYAHKMWIMGRDGTLLYHPGQSEIGLRNGYRRDTKCTSCHRSLAFTERMLKDGEGMIEYQPKTLPRKVAAFSHMDVENASWIVAVTSGYDDITAFASRSLRGHLILLSIVVLTVIGSSVLISRNRLLKTRAEGELKRWQEKRVLEDRIRQSERQLRSLSSQILNVQEEERRRISRELHDELGQALAVLKLQVRFIEKNAQSGGRKIQEECESVVDYIDQTLENVRRLSRELSPTLLEDLGLSSALRWLIKNFIEKSGIPVTSEIADIDPMFREENQVIIYRIVQEALTNIWKHAEAKQVSITVKKQDGGISLSVEDDGKGFDTRSAIMRNPFAKGLGLAIMVERARMLGVSLEIWSQEGKGTRIALDIPVEEGRAS